MPCQFNIENYSEWSTQTVKEMQEQYGNVCIGGVPILAGAAYDPRNTAVIFHTPTGREFSCQENLSLATCIESRMQTTMTDRKH